ncbi:helicase associated domain-containing protein [Kitasatospora sp. NPDC101157]|uniref:helicase associated domain-containing protein n=1 Tax=Kitasatospora sp. NPDC101157 TaxID=3364098 RepID=UPI00380D80FC
MVWSKHAGAWDRGYACARAWAAHHGHLAIPATEKLDGYAVGAWMRRQRKAENLGADQAAKLDALDELWRLEPDWNRSYRRLLAYLAAGGTLDGPANRTGGEADPAFRPGTWLRKQDKAPSGCQTGAAVRAGPGPRPGRRRPGRGPASRRRPPWVVRRSSATAERTPAAPVPPRTTSSRGTVACCTRFRLSLEYGGRIIALGLVDGHD